MFQNILLAEYYAKVVTCLSDKKLSAKYPEKIIIMILDYPSSSVINICSNGQFY
jgi:hypothetical protein